MDRLGAREREPAPPPQSPLPGARHPEPLLTSSQERPDASNAASTPWARFDDLRPGGRSFALREPTAVLEAHDASRVAATVQRAADAAAAGHWVAGFVSYEAAPGFDPGLQVRAPAAGLPLAWFGVFTRHDDLPPITAGSTGATPWTLEWNRATHAERVERIKTLIAAGDTYQVNLTARARASIDDPLALYAAMAVAQQGAHNAFVITGSHAVICASPELFFALDGEQLVTRPMKGTARRGRWPAEDEAMATALESSSKDRAENVMIVDLMRNDVGRIARTGSVDVPALARLERYPTVWQLTSTVTGRLGPDAGLAPVFTALFPAGSVTGAPKRRTMELITSLEDSPRGVYCGAVGFVEPGSPTRATFAVAIRTATVELATGRAEYGAGGAITWSSEPGAEWDELAAKMQVLDHPALPPGLLETLLVDGEVGPVHLDRHLARMQASARYFSFPFDEGALRAAVARGAGGAVDRLRLRVTLTRDGAVGVDTFPAPPPDARPLRLAFADEPVDSRDPWLFHKTTDREPYDRRFRRFAGTVDDVVLWNERGEATETTTATLAVEVEGRWWTPPLACGLLPGVERGRLLEVGTLHERVLTVADVRRAPALALVNSLRGWRPAALAP